LSAEYITKALLSPVLFEEASQHIPHNAITVEIAPHGLLHPILEHSLNRGITNIALTQRGYPVLFKECNQKNPSMGNFSRGTSNGPTFGKVCVKVQECNSATRD
jgi:hypothetical protein